MTSSLLSRYHEWPWDRILNDLAGEFEKYLTRARQADVRAKPNDAHEKLEEMSLVLYEQLLTAIPPKLFGLYTAGSATPHDSVLAELLKSISRIICRTTIPFGFAVGSKRQAYIDLLEGDLLEIFPGLAAGLAYRRRIEAWSWGLAEFPEDLRAVQISRTGKTRDGIDELLNKASRRDNPIEARQTDYATITCGDELWYCDIEANLCQTEPPLHSAGQAGCTTSILGRLGPRSCGEPICSSVDLQTGVRWYENPQPFVLNQSSLVPAQTSATGESSDSDTGVNPSANREPTKGNDTDSKTALANSGKHDRPENPVATLGKHIPMAHELVRIRVQGNGAFSPLGDVLPDQRRSWYRDRWGHYLKSSRFWERILVSGTVQTAWEYCLPWPESSQLSASGDPSFGIGEGFCLAAKAPPAIPSEPASPEITKPLDVGVQASAGNRGASYGKTKRSTRTKPASNTKRRKGWKG